MNKVRLQKQKRERREVHVLRMRRTKRKSERKKDM